MVAAGLLEGALQELSEAPQVERIRSYVRDHDRRRRYVDGAMNYLKRERSRPQGAYDIVLVGAGLHAAAFLYTLRRSNKKLRVLLTEKSSDICSTFARLGDSLVLNSPTFSKVGLNSNIVQGHFVQVSDFDEVIASPFPTAKHLHELATMVLFHADADILFGFEVDDIRRSGAEYAVSSRTMTVQARTVIVSNGMGEPTTGSFMRDGRSEKVIVGDDFISRWFRDRGLPSSVEDKRVAVIGAGDTANCVMECLVPLVYPSRHHAVCGPARLLPRSILWIGQGARDVREYYFANKRRYCHSGGVIELFWDGDGPLELSAHVWSAARKAIHCVREPLLSLHHRSSALELTTAAGGFEADLVIDCTGRTNRLSASLLENDYQFIVGDITLHGGRWDEHRELFTASPRLLKERRIACKLRGERVFFIGSACPLCELVPDEEARDGSLRHQERRTSLTDSKWSLEHTLPRSVALAQQLAGRSVREGARSPSAREAPGAPRSPSS